MRVCSALDHALINAVESAKLNSPNYSGSHWISQVLAIYMGWSEIGERQGPVNLKALNESEMLLRAFVAGGMPCVEKIDCSINQRSRLSPPQKFRIPVEGE